MESTHCIQDAHEQDINSIAFIPVNEFLSATGSSNKTVALWDMRNLKCSPPSLISCTQTLRAHIDEDYNVEWAPSNESIPASCPSNRQVMVMLDEVTTTRVV
eukprot:104949_1